MPAIRVRIEGTVQGVGFRGYVMRVAREYHLRGEVWNSADGSVQAILQSDNSGNLERAVDMLRQGPGHVENVHSNNIAAELNYDGFSVTATRAD